MSKIMVILGVLILWGCEPPPEKDKAALIEEAVQERIDRLYATKKRRCQEDLLTDATAIADSILLRQARFFLDTLSRPPRPQRPGRPQLNFERDRSAITPLFSIDSLLAAQARRRDSIRQWQERIDSLPLLDTLLLDSLERDSLLAPQIDTIK